MFRGYTTTPYPHKRLLKYIYEHGGKIIVTGDCHKAEALGKYRELATELAKECGFTKQTVITEKGFLEIDL
jgi:histidinol-phosphatase (PHP family)